jgi:hydroxyacylglutathione hydrolase
MYGHLSDPAREAAVSPDVEVIETNELGDRTHVVHDGTSAVVIDPQRDVDRIEHVLDAHGLRCALVLETHIHNDYVTGGLALARSRRARYGVAADDDVAFEREPLRDRDELGVGALRIRVVATPGHTPSHVSYIVDDGDGPAAVFTGGSLLYGSVGRTDLVDPARTDELTRAQFRSARRLVELAGDDDAVFPTHGFGSYCSAGSATGGRSSTIAAERARNDSLTEPDEDAFVARLTAGLTAYPRYYAHMSARNRQGPAPADLSAPRPVSADELRARIAAGEWAVDLRDRTAHAAGHVAGSIGIALGPHFATWLGWLIPWDSALTLVGDSAEQVSDAQRQLVRIGIDRPDGAAVGTPQELAGPDGPRNHPVARFADLAVARRTGQELVVLDVRRADERARGWVPDSTHIPMHALPDHLDDVPAGRVWVHCASGFRASIAASLLHRAGRDVVLVDEDYAAAVECGLATG